MCCEFYEVVAPFARCVQSEVWLWLSYDLITAWKCACYCDCDYYDYYYYY